MADMRCDEAAENPANRSSYVACRRKRTNICSGITDRIALNQDTSCHCRTARALKAGDTEAVAGSSDAGGRHSDVAARLRVARWRTLRSCGIVCAKPGRISPSAWPVRLFWPSGGPDCGFRRRRSRREKVSLVQSEVDPRNSERTCFRLPRQRHDLRVSLA
jgi:hypothetical protein